MNQDYTKDVSIVIVSYNCCSFLRKCLLSISEQSGALALEIVVIDNASTDGSAEMVQREFPAARLIRNERNLGFASANNQGIRVCCGRHVLLLNPDTIVLRGCLMEVLQCFDQHPELGALGCRALWPNGGLQRNCYLFPSELDILMAALGLPSLFPHNRFFGRQDFGWWDYSSDHAVDYVSGCFLLLRREAIERVGLLDERFFMFAEELDWCYRLKAVGCQVGYTPRGTIIHWGGQSCLARFSQMHIHRRKGLLTFFEKHKGIRSRWRVNCLLGLHSLVRLLPLLCLAGMDKHRARARLSAAWSTLQYHLVDGWWPAQP